MTVKAIYQELDDGSHYDIRTPERVVKALHQARTRQVRVRIFYGDTKTGEAWSEENDVTGRIGRSTGSVKVPLIINNRRSMGGPQILDHCIVGIVFRDRSNCLQWLYRHPTFNPGNWTYHSEDVHTGEKAHVCRDGKLHARFDNFKRAFHYYQFMMGERMGK